MLRHRTVGHDPFPWSFNWEQPGCRSSRPIKPREQRRQLPELSYSANKITVTRGGLNPIQRPDQQPFLALSRLGAFTGPSRPSGVLGRAGYGQALWNEAPFLTNWDLFILKDDYSAVFGKHLIKAGGLASFFNKKNEMLRLRIGGECRVLGLDGHRPREHHRQHPR